MGGPSTDDFRTSSRIGRETFTGPEAKSAIRGDGSTRRNPHGPLVAVVGRRGRPAAATTAGMRAIRRPGRGPPHRHGAHHATPGSARRHNLILAGWPGKSARYSPKLEIIYQQPSRRIVLPRLGGMFDVDQAPAPVGCACGRPLRRRVRGQRALPKSALLSDSGAEDQSGGVRYRKVLGHRLP